MKALSFPNIFKTNMTSTLSDKEATLSNLKLLLGSEKGELLGDPYYGLTLKTYLFDQNNKILKDIIIDDIYTQLVLFMPQLIVSRNDIIVTQEKATVRVLITATDKADYTTDLYNIVLFQENEQ